MTTRPKTLPGHDLAVASKRSSCAQRRRSKHRFSCRAGDTLPTIILFLISRSPGAADRLHCDFASRGALRISGGAFGQATTYFRTVNNFAIEGRYSPQSCPPVADGRAGNRQGDRLRGAHARVMKLKNE